MSGTTQIAREFRKFVAKKGYDVTLWFEEEPVDGFDSGERIAVVGEPYVFLAEKLGINIRVSVETAGDPEHYVVTYERKIVLEEADLDISNFCWSDQGFEEWFQKTTEKWRNKLALAKLLFS
jgi:hypothetical protein